ncbi:GNAT family N-acetyltransferase [Alkalihalobacillus sp. 1P02AB]|uniref:GNAT family N-acetyltransferase n=1 Tax=Alkalihalobacillus sp. 1P02AB TaxID=3132260 RepID=UPI0039A406B0
MSKNIKLRAFELFDVSALHHWLNDEESISMVGRTPMTKEETENYVLHLRKENALIMAIENQEKELVGWVHLSNVSHGHGRAEIGLLLAPEFRGHGYGKEAMEEMIKMGFHQLRLHKIYLTTRAINERAIGLYKKLGFQVEGTLRQHSFINGTYYDTIFMGLLASEWNQIRNKIEN